MPNVWVDSADIIDDINDDDLISEIESRGYKVSEFDDKIEPEPFIPLISELYKDYHAYGYTDKFKKLLEDFFEEVKNA